MAWAAPAVALQWAVGGDRLWLRRKLLLAAVAVPACYLCLVDRLALSLDLWVLSPERTTGVAVAGLPVEELLFFLLTTLLVAGGLFLASDPVARGRVCAVVTACTGSSIRSENSRSPVGVVDRQTS
jgi:lycopene cyclase domain-containing protein